MLYLEQYTEGIGRKCDKKKTLLIRQRLILIMAMNFASIIIIRKLLLSPVNHKKKNSHIYFNRLILSMLNNILRRWVLTVSNEGTFVLVY